MDRVQDEYLRGRNDGAADVANGAPKLFWQTRGRWGEYMSQLMADRFRVSVEHTSDITWADLDSYRDGYNEVVKSHVERQFGSGAFEAALAEVERFRAESYRQQFGLS